MPEAATASALPVDHLGPSIVARVRVTFPVVSTPVSPIDRSARAPDRPLYTLYDTLLI